MYDNFEKDGFLWEIDTEKDEHPRADGVVKKKKIFNDDRITAIFKANKRVTVIDLENGTYEVDSGDIVVIVDNKELNSFVKSRYI